MATKKTSDNADKDSKIFDVAKPGETAADPTSRPIIVGHGKALQPDPMVVEDNPAPDTEEIKEKPKRELVLNPVSEAAEEDTPAEPDEVAEETPAESKETETPQNSDSAAVDELAAGLTTKQEKDKVSQEELKKIEEVEKLINSKQFFVKTKTPPGKRNLLWLLGFVVVAIIGGAWFLLLGPGKDMWAKPVAEPEPATSQPAALEPSQPAPAVSALSSFSNTNLGVEFKYPAGWGDASVSDNSKITSEKGKRVVITFSKNKTMAAGMKSKDWTDSSKDVMANCSQPGFTGFVLEKTAMDNGKQVILEKSDIQVFEELTGGLCSDKQIVGNKKFTKSKDYTGLQIWYQEKVSDNFDLAQRIADYKKDQNKYFAKELRDQLIAATESATEL